MMDLYISSVLYLLGALFMLTSYEPEEGSPKFLYVLFVFGWPVMTLWILFMNLFENE